VEFLVAILLVVLLVAGLLALAIWLYIVRQGDEKIVFVVDQRSDCRLEALTGQAAVLSCKVPFVNKGTQDGTLIDVFPRVLLPYEQFDAVEVSAKLTLESNRRTDGYWEALIIPQTTGDAALITITFMAQNTDIREALGEMVDMSIDIVYHIVGRSTCYIAKTRIVITADEIAKALEQQPGAQSEVL
jgi:hypothetical protein